MKSKIKYIISSVFIIYLLNLIRINLSEIIGVQFVNNSDIDFLFLNIVLFGPLKEENLFRYYIDFKKKYLYILLPTLIIVLLGQNFKSIRIYFDIALLMYSFIFFFKKDKLINDDKKMSIRKIVIVFILNLFFYIFHFWNYENINLNLLIITTPNPWSQTRIKLIESNETDNLWINDELVAWYSFGTLSHLLERKGFVEYFYDYYNGQNYFDIYKNTKGLIGKLKILKRKLVLVLGRKQCQDGLFFVSKLSK